MEDFNSLLSSRLFTSNDLAMPDKKSVEDLRLALAEQINRMISHDPGKLMQILYRVDVSEKMLKKNLENQEAGTGEIIAGLIIERQLQKIESRRQFKSTGDIPENEKW